MEIGIDSFAGVDIRHGLPTAADRARAVAELLERIEHADPKRPLYSVLQCATANPQATPGMLVIQLATDMGINVDEQSTETLLSEARKVFAQLVADEVADTLEKPDSNAVTKEIKSLGLSKAFVGIAAKP